METERTPGPWYTAEATGIIAVLSSPTAEDRANAKLIAAAPELLAAAKAALEYDKAMTACANDPNKMASFCTSAGENLDRLYLDWRDKSKTAIAKAQGK